MNDNVKIYVLRYFEELRNKNKEKTQFILSTCSSLVLTIDSHIGVASEIFCCVVLRYLAEVQTFILHRDIAYD